ISYPSGDKSRGMTRISLNFYQVFLIHEAKLLKTSWGYF
ncbi:hypothetical protein DBR06_SOUSAS1310065, partial [Sousa chinensis]